MWIPEMFVHQNKANETFEVTRHHPFGDTIVATCTNRAWADHITQVLNEQYKHNSEQKG